MLCSNCSALIKPVVAIDIDGTLGNYHDHFMRFACDWLDVADPDDLPYYNGQRAYKDWFCDLFGTDATTFRQVKLAYRQGGMKRTMPQYEGASMLAATLVRNGAEVWLTTTRPHDRFDRVDPDTREWLRRNLITFDGLLYSEDKMGELLERIDPERILAVVDDEVEQLTSAEALFGRVGILRRTRHNEAVKWSGDALPDLFSVATVLMDRISDWTKAAA